MSDDDPEKNERDEGAGDNHEIDSSLDDLLRSISDQADDDNERPEELQDLADLTEEKNMSEGTSLDDLLEKVEPDKQIDEGENSGDTLANEGTGTETESSLDDSLLDDFSGQTEPRRQSDEGKGTKDSRGEKTDEESSLDDLLGEVKTDKQSRSERGARSSSGREGGTDLDLPADSGSGDSSIGGMNIDSQQTGPTHPQIDPETIQGASDILVLESAGVPDLETTCVPFFTMSSPGRQNALFISLTGSVDDSLEVLQRAESRSLANVGVVTVDETVRSTGQESVIEYDLGDITINTVSDPSDLTRLGLTISKTASSWEGSSTRPIVCFRSLTALLQYADPESVFRFLHVLQGRLSAVDAIAHYHMDADAHDQQTIATLRTLFDTVIDVTPDGDFNVTRE